MNNITFKNAYTLVELMVVVAIIALLAVMISSLVIDVQNKMDKTKTGALIDGFQLFLHPGMKSPIPLPDRLTLPTTEAEKRVGYLIYDASESKPGIVNELMYSGFTFDYSHMVDEQNRVTDAWGNPLHFVLGDFKNRNDRIGYDPGKPQDLNKPKDATIPANKSDWNTADRGGFPYIYSTGVPDPLKHEWIYSKH